MVAAACSVAATCSRWELDQRLEGAATGAATEPGYFKPNEATAYLAGTLPHWRQEGVTYFVTFRCADSLPQEKLLQWKTERDGWLLEHPEPLDETEQQAYRSLFSDRIEHWLDQGYGACLLARAEYRGLVENALRYFDSQRYHLGQYVVMPNHVHVVVTPLPACELSGILHSWKSFTANQINKLSGSTGAFWQKESFDQILRSPAHLERVNQYISEHPRSSGFQPLAVAC